MTEVRTLWRVVVVIRPVIAGGAARACSGINWHGRLIGLLDLRSTCGGAGSRAVLMRAARSGYTNDCACLEGVLAGGGFGVDNGLLGGRLDTLVLGFSAFV